VLIIQNTTKSEQIVEPELVSLIVNSVPAIIAYWDKDLRCGFANRAYRDWLGTPGKALVGLSMTEVLGEHLFRLNRKYIQGALDGYRQRFKLEMIDARGRRKTALVFYVPDLADDCVLGFSVLAVDIGSV
jgi:PAS domain S-box-containing protein